MGYLIEVSNRTPNGGRIVNAQRIGSVLLVCGLVFGMLGCMSPKGASPDEKRSYVRKARNETLLEVYAQNPNLEQ